MLILGLTGGIATGKSSASQYFRSRAVPVVDADQLARAVVEPGRPAYYRIIEQFGHMNILQDDQQQLDRKRLGELIFSDEYLRRQLNRCTHMYIRRNALKELITHFFRFESIVVWDVPLLFEVGLDRYLSYTLVIACDAHVQFNRLKHRDHMTDDEQVRQRIAAQMSLDEKCRRARYVIDNTGQRQALDEQLNEFFHIIQPNRHDTWTWFVVLCVPLAFTYGVLRLWDLFDRIKYCRRSTST
jgi:dephospho-CoA kinase